jgi:hypothetical protein
MSTINPLNTELHRVFTELHGVRHGVTTEVPLPGGARGGFIL